MTSIRIACIPRKEVLTGDLEDAIFAADFSLVMEGLAPSVYGDPQVFFQNTYPTTTLKKVISTIFGRLASTKEAGAALRLSTAFGGGKTHTLLALWHLARNINNLTLGTEVLPAAGRPMKVIVAGADAGKFGKPICATHGDIQTHTLWGELAYQLGGEPSYRKIEATDNLQSHPNIQDVRSMLPDEPTLILLDELVIYMATLDEEAQNSLLSFLGMLISTIGARKQAVLVITDPAGQAVYQKQAIALANATSQIAAANRLNDVLGRSMSDYDPIGSEAAQVIARRLFEHIDPNAAQTISAEYYSCYQRVVTEHPDLLPGDVAKKEYAQKIVECYPFHPRLLDTAQGHLAALQNYNKSRGTLRLFARFLRDIWENKSDLGLITAGDIDWSSERIQSDLLARLDRDNFKAAVDADISRHAAQLDTEYSTDIHNRVASALLLESLPINSNAAMDRKDITLAILRPSDVGSEPSEAIDRLMSVCWHTYRTEAGKYQFRYDPNVNKLIEERAQQISLEDAKAKVLTLVQSYFGGRTFQLQPWPDHPQDVPDTAKLKLILCQSESLAKDICSFEDDTNPDAKRPRRFRNAIFAIAPTLEMLTNAVLEMRRWIAADQINDEENKSKKKSLLKEQLEDLLPKLGRIAKLQSYRAFNRVVFQGRPIVTLDEKFLVPDENALGIVNGQGKLKEFLDEKKYVYQSTDAIDPMLLIELVQGATPSIEHDGAFTASSVHERALSSERLRLMMTEDPVRNSVIKAVEQGLFSVRLANGEVYDQKGCVSGLKGDRKRMVGRKIPSLQLIADVLIAPNDAACIAEWVKEDEEPKFENLITIEYAATEKGVPAERIADAADAGQINSVVVNGERKIVIDTLYNIWLPTSPAILTATSWDEAIAYSASRPLMDMILSTVIADTAGQLLLCAQPMNAKNINLTIMTGGDFKDGGKINLSLIKVKPTSAIKPIDFAQKVLRALEDGSMFKVELDLDFGDEPQTAATSRLVQAHNASTDHIQLQARFGPEK